MEKEKVIENIIKEFGYTKEDLENWEWVNVEELPSNEGDIYFDGTFVLFPTDKIVWYSE